MFSFFSQSNDKAPEPVVDIVEEEKNSAHREVLKGELSPELYSIIRFGQYTSVAATASVVAYGITSFTESPIGLVVPVNALFSGSLIYLTGLSYGIVNDLMAVRVNLPYFLVGHNPNQKSLIKSNDPNTVAIGWGIVGTVGLSFISGLLFTTATAITGGIGLPFPGFVYPLVGATVPLVLWRAHVNARRVQNFPLDRYSYFFTKLELLRESNAYQQKCLDEWVQNPEDLKAWLSNSERNGTGYLWLPLIGLLGLTSTIVFSATHDALPSILFESGLSTLTPLSLGALLATGIGIANAYLHINKDKQLDNEYKLDFTEQESVATYSSSNARIAAIANIPADQMFITVEENEKVEEKSQHLLENDIEQPQEEAPASRYLRCVVS